MWISHRRTRAKILLVTDPAAHYSLRDGCLANLGSVQSKLQFGAVRAAHMIHVWSVYSAKLQLAIPDLIS